VGLAVAHSQATVEAVVVRHIGVSRATHATLTSAVVDGDGLSHGLTFLSKSSLAGGCDSLTLGTAVHTLGLPAASLLDLVLCISVGHHGPLGHVIAVQASIALHSSPSLRANVAAPPLNGEHSALCAVDHGLASLSVYLLTLYTMPAQKSRDKTDNFVTVW